MLPDRRRGSTGRYVELHSLLSLSLHLSLLFRGLVAVAVVVMCWNRAHLVGW